MFPIIERTAVGVWCRGLLRLFLKGHFRAAGLAGRPLWSPRLGLDSCALALRTLRRAAAVPVLEDAAAEAEFLSDFIDWFAKGEQLKGLSFELGGVDRTRFLGHALPWWLWV